MEKQSKNMEHKLKKEKERLKKKKKTNMFDWDILSYEENLYKKLKKGKITKKTLESMLIKTEGRSISGKFK